MFLCVAGLATTATIAVFLGGIEPRSLWPEEELEGGEEVEKPSCLRATYRCTDD